MAYIPRSSFIPKEASGAIPVQVRRRRTVHVFGLIATVLLTIATVSSIAVFLYKDYLGAQLETAKERLAGKSDEGNQGKIEEVKKYNHKLQVARDLLDNHIAPSLLFEEIENSTKGTVRFRDFDFLYDPGFDALLTLGGSTGDLESVLLQKAQMSEDGIFTEFFVNDITTSDQAGEPDLETGAPVPPVSFVMTGIVNKNLVNYREAVPAPAPESEDAGTESEDVPADESLPEAVTDGTEETEVLEPEPDIPPSI